MKERLEETKMSQKEIQKGFRMVKIRTETYYELERLIQKIEKRQPYIKGLVGFNAVILMLLQKKRIKLSKYRYLEEVK